MKRHYSGLFFFKLRVVFTLSLIFTSNGFSVQTVTDVSQETILDSTVEPDWMVTTETIDPVKETTQILKGKSSPMWKQTQVPGQLHSGNLPVGNYLKALVTLSEPNGFQNRLHEWWLKKEIILPVKISTNLAIRLGKISDADIVYFNGVEIGRTGEIGSARPMAYDRTRLYEIPYATIKHGQKNIVLIKIGNYFADEAGLSADYTAIGTSATMLANFAKSEYIKLALLVAYLTAGAYFLLLFVRRPKEKDHLHYGLFTICLVVYQFLRSDVKFDLGISLYWLKKVEYAVLTLLFVTIIEFAIAFFKIKKGWFAKLIESLLVVFCIVYIIHPSLRIHSFSIKYLNFLMLGTVLLLIGHLIRQLWLKNIDAYYLSGGFFCLLAGTIVDILSTSNIINVPRMAGYAFIIFVLGIAGILANRFVRLNEQIEDMNVNLEKKVELRTQELQTTLSEVQALKVQQDGDYFLTSLLIKPLGVNRALSENVRISFLVQQKKKFQFKNWDAEIGGDMCIAHSISLKGRKYVAFVNGDAMGKSIQGAGGALVLGVVFNSVVARTQVSTQAQQKFPEQWLRDCFMELQSIFMNFDGSMLVSVVMGLVDEENGLLFLINAEHPHSVLLREQKATFLEEEGDIRKIGIEGVESNFQVQAFNLQKNDIIIMGSDGRDDFIVGTQADGQRIINEDEFQFLKRVEESRGDLAQILEGIQKSGELTDDLTLMRLEFLGEGLQRDIMGESTEADDENVHLAKQLLTTGSSGELLENLKSISKFTNPQIAKEMIKVLHKTKQFRESIVIAEKAMQEFPDDLDFIYQAAFALKRCREYKKAADYGERFRLRQKKNIKNLINLADIYRLDNNFDRCDRLIAEAEEIEPEYAPMLQLKMYVAQLK